MRAQKLTNSSAVADKLARRAASRHTARSLVENKIRDGNEDRNMDAHER